MKATHVPAVKQYRVSLLESTSYAGWVTASSAEEAVAIAMAEFAKEPDDFKVMDSGVDHAEVIDEAEADDE